MSQFDVATLDTIPEKIFVGRRVADPLPSRRGRALVIVRQDTVERELSVVGRHSPTGFEWGYLGSGPAELALSILTEHLGFEPPPELYERFKVGVVARFPELGWSRSSRSIAAWIARNTRSLG